MSSFRIAVTGAQGTGKTTLAQDLATALQKNGWGQVDFLAGIGDQVRARNLPLGKNATFDTICAFAALHLQRERCATSGVVVQDRCLLDLYAYAVLQGHTSGLFGELLREQVRASLSRLNYILYVPLAPELRECRSINETSDTRFKIDALIRKFSLEWHVPIREVKGDRKQRLSSALAIVEMTSGKRHYALEPDPPVHDI